MFLSYLVMTKKDYFLCVSFFRFFHMLWYVQFSISYFTLPSWRNFAGKVRNLCVKLYLNRCVWYSFSDDHYWKNEIHTNSAEINTQDLPESLLYLCYCIHYSFCTQVRIVVQRVNTLESNWEAPDDNALVTISSLRLLHHE